MIRSLYPATGALLAATAFAGSATAYQQRPARIDAPTAIRTPPATITAPPIVRRIPPAPQFLNPAQLRQRVPVALPASIFPNLKSDFSLTPAVQSVSGRGSMQIQGVVTVPDPLPPGFTGHASISYRLVGLGQASWFGGVFLTIKAQKNVFYVIDCLANISGNENVDFKITGAGAPQSGKTKVQGGHIVLNARRTADTGDISIAIRPETYVPAPSPIAGDKNVMDFWGCQISTA